MSSFYIEALENTVVTISVVGTLANTPSLRYSMNDRTYVDYTLGNTMTFSSGRRYFKGTNETFCQNLNNRLSISSTGRIKVGGDIMSLRDEWGDYTDFPSDNFFCGLFRDCTKLVDASDLILSAPTLRTKCYYHMFHGCTALTGYPQFEATTLAQECYEGMFMNCTSLTTLPTFTWLNYPFASLANMFNGCSNIKVSSTVREGYNITFRIPNEGTGTYAYGWADNMFLNTGGTFKSGPTINKTYYLYGELPPPVTKKEGVYTGSNKIGKVMIGNTEISKVFDGNTLIYGEE